MQAASGVPQLRLCDLASDYFSSILCFTFRYMLLWILRGIHWFRDVFQTNAVQHTRGALRPVLVDVNSVGPCFQFWQHNQYMKKQVLSTWAPGFYWRCKGSRVRERDVIVKGGRGQRLTFDWRRQNFVRSWSNCDRWTVGCAFANKVTLRMMQIHKRVETQTQNKTCKGGSVFVFKLELQV